MPGPVQHITMFVAVNDGSGDFTAETAGLNADRPAGYPNAWPGGVTDPSTNNEVDGPNLIRNQFVDGMLKHRTLRDGGSGRPQYRIPGVATCVARTYTIQGDEFGASFVVDSDMLPLDSTDFVAIMVAAGIEFTADDSIWVMTDHLLSKDEINMLAGMDTGWLSLNAHCTNTVDGDCGG